MESTLRKKNEFTVSLAKQGYGSCIPCNHKLTKKQKTASIRSLQTFLKAHTYYKTIQNWQYSKHLTEDRGTYGHVSKVLL